MEKEKIDGSSNTSRLIGAGNTQNSDSRDHPPLRVERHTDFYLGACAPTLLFRLLDRFLP
jgi:hypothetical protein